ncbi:threonine synthase [Paenibacillus sp. HB172176]|uniref:threonine synthase n=1 Tax=Paenibacillus sp. HB172176 TaxID=2493690 RepID=UPI001439C385|nr:threonine synthase [Paenibacillus sp. HB172176]
MTRLRVTCSRCGSSAAFTYEEMNCVCGGVRLVEYDLALAAKTLTKQALLHRPASMWRYKELLPVAASEDIVSLGEGWTPLSLLSIAELKLPVDRLWIKREELNPTGSFKARGMSVAVSLLKERGKRTAALASNGNAASALAAYAASAGMDACVFVPEDCPPYIVQECRHYGADTFRVKGLIHDAGQWVEAGRRLFGWSSVSTLKEPGRVEGKKTMGFELAEQLNWQLPSVIVYPTGGGSGVIGMWKAFRELKELRMITGPLPRMVCVQASGCAPLAAAMGKADSGSETPAATGMRVPRPPDLELLVRILREMKGTAVAVTQDEIKDAQRAMGARGISASPEGAATWAGFVSLCEEGWIQPKDRVVLFNTSHAMKYELHCANERTPLLGKLNPIL